MTLSGMELAQLEKLAEGFKVLRQALAEIELRCGAPGSEQMQQRQDIYDIARIALERIDVPSSPNYMSDIVIASAQEAKS